MRPKVSVVIPVYNAAKYVEQCINSILEQTFIDFELILVDDGSTDGSLEIGRRYTTKDTRVKLIEQAHSNAGEARNLGLLQAKGKYITFLDSDDFFEIDLLEKEYIQIIKDDADVCACNGNQYNDRSGEYEDVDFFLIREYLPDNIPFSMEDCPDHIFQIIATGPWVRMYRLDFIRKNNLTYQSIVRGNDVFFSNMALALAGRITVVDEILIHHRVGLTNNLQSGLKYTPDIYIDIDIAWKEELEKRCLFRRCYKSFGMYVLNNLRSHYRRNDEKGREKIKARLKDGALRELGFIDFFKERTKEIVSHPEKYGNGEESSWIDFAKMLMTWEFPEKDENLSLLVDKLGENKKHIDEGSEELDVCDLFPFEFISRGSNVLIYGLGKVGKKYIKQNRITRWCKVIGVSDKKEENNVYCYKFYSMTEISSIVNLDKVIIAIADSSVSKEVEKEMLINGLPKEKIFALGRKRL